MWRRVPHCVHRYSPVRRPRGAPPATTILSDDHWVRIPILAQATDFQRVRSRSKGAQIEVDLDSYGKILQLRGRLLAECDPSVPINQPEFVLPGFGTDR